MTEKRFKLDSEIGFIDTQKCGGDTMTLFEVVVELNKLNKENEQLKENCKNYNWYKQYKTLLKENEQLKQTVSDWSGSYDELFEDIKRLEEENEQLKSENQRLSEQKYIYKQDWKHLCIDKELLDSENEQLKEHLSTWRSSCCNYLNVYSILDNEVSILKETKDLDRFFEKFDKYSKMPFYEVEKSFIELQKENEQLKQQLFEARKEYLIETADISDKLYLDEMIEEERKEIFE